MPAPGYFDSAPPHDALIFWVIYHRPADVPGSEYVVRPQYADAYTGRLICSPIARQASTLAEARELIPHYRTLYRMERQPKDDPIVLETWF
jgi:hypothetical protein